MSDFFKAVIDNARKTATEVFDKVEAALIDVDKRAVQEDFQDWDDVSPESLLYEIDVLNEELQEARTALKLFMDGETQVSFGVSNTQLQVLDQYIVETYWEGDSEGGLSLTVKQRKI